MPGTLYLERSLELPSNFTEKPEPVQPRDAEVHAGVGDLERPGGCPAGLLPGYHRPMAHPCEGDHKGVRAPPFGLRVDDSWARLHDLRHRSHLSLVQGEEETIAGAQYLGEVVRSPFQLLQYLVGRHEITSSDGGVEPVPEGHENVWGVVPADSNPDACINHVGRRHALPSGSYVLDRPCNVLQMLQSDA